MDNSHRVKANRARLKKDIQIVCKSLERRVLDVTQREPDLDESETKEQCEDIARHAETLLRLVTEYQR